MSTTPKRVFGFAASLAEVVLSSLFISRSYAQVIHDDALTTTPAQSTFLTGNAILLLLIGVMFIAITFALVVVFIAARRSRAHLLIGERNVLLRVATWLDQTIGKAQATPATRSAAVETIACPQCGAQNPASARFCRSCGAALAIAREPAPQPAPTHLSADIGYATDKGMLRETNEDDFGTAVRDVPDHPTILLAVADGMGGEDAGEVASRMVIHSLKQSFAELETVDGAPYNEWVQQAFQRANALISTEARQRRNQMGTTLVLALIHDTTAYLGHVGDSRMYRWNPRRDGGRMVRLTRDHSLVQRLVDLGHLTDEERYVHPERNMVLRTIGDLRTGKPDVAQPVSVQDGDWLLLCCDGLWEMVRDDHMRDILLQSAGAQDACDRLITEANRNGGEDNITVVIAHFTNH